MTKVCISGYYGFDNVGDEAILLSIINSIRKNFPDIGIIVLSNKPEKTAETYGVEAYDRWKWWQIHKAIMASDLLISGGGGLLQDVSGKKSLLYYTQIMKMAMRRKKPVFIFSQGIGPVNSKWGQEKIVKVLRKASKIAVRDEASADMLQSWGLRKGRIRVTADPVLTIGNVNRVWDTEKFVRILDPSRFDENNINADCETEIEICLVDQGTLNNIVADNVAKIEAKAAAEKIAVELEKTKEQGENVLVEDESVVNEVCLEEESTVETFTVEEVTIEEPQVETEETQEEPKKIINYEDYDVMGLHPRLWTGDDEKLAIYSIRDWENLPINDIAKAADLTVKAGYKVVFLPFQYPNDVEISKKVIDLMTEPAHLFDGKAPLTPEEIMTVMDEADFVFGMRLHSLIMAAVAKKPFAALSYNPKVKSFTEQVGLTVVGDLDEYDAVTFLEAMDGVLKNPDALVELMEEHLEELTAKAESTIELIRSLLERIQRRSERKIAPDGESTAEKIAKRKNRRSSENKEQENSFEEEIEESSVNDEENFEELEIVQNDSLIKEKKEND